MVSPASVAPIVFAFATPHQTATDVIQRVPDPWETADTVARVWQVASGFALLAPDVTASKAVAASGVVPSVYLGARGLWKIVHQKNIGEGAWDVGTSVVAGAVFVRAAQTGVHATRALVATRWQGLPPLVRYGIPAVLVYPFAQEVFYSWAMVVRSRFLAPQILGTPLEPFFPSLQGINARTPYEIQMEQEAFRAQSLAFQRASLVFQREVRSRLDRLENRCSLDISDKAAPLLAAP